MRILSARGSPRCGLKAAWSARCWCLCCTSSLNKSQAECCGLSGQQRSPALNKKSQAIYIKWFFFHKIWLLSFERIYHAHPYFSCSLILSRIISTWRVMFEEFRLPKYLNKKRWIIFCFLRQFQWFLLSFLNWISVPLLESFLLPMFSHSFKNSLWIDTR